MNKESFWFDIKLSYNLLKPFSHMMKSRDSRLVCIKNAGLGSGETRLALNETNIGFLKIKCSLQFGTAQLYRQLVYDKLHAENTIIKGFLPILTITLTSLSL